MFARSQQAISATFNQNQNSKYKIFSKGWIVLYDNILWDENFLSRLITYFPSCSPKMFGLENGEKAAKF
jgi:hypothetical protein